MGAHACRNRCCICVCVLAILAVLGGFACLIIYGVTERPPAHPVLPVNVDGVSAARFELDGGANTSSTTLSYDLALNLSTNGEYIVDVSPPAYLIYKLTVRVLYGGVLLGYVDLVRPPTSPLMVPDDVGNGALPTAMLQGRVVLPGDSPAAQQYRREEAEELFMVDLRLDLAASLDLQPIRFWLTTSRVALRRPSGSSSPSSAFSPSVGQPPQKPTAPAPQPSPYN